MLNMTCFCLCERSEAISREGEVLQSIYFIALVVGYFAYAQYDVLFPYVILNDSEESHRRTDRHILFHFGRGIFRLRSI